MSDEGFATFSPMPEVGHELDLAIAALAAGDPLACGHHVALARMTMTEQRHSVPPDDVYDSAMQIAMVALLRWVPALLAYAGTVRDDEVRWGHYRTARVAVLGVLASYEVLPGYAAEDLAELRARCGPLLEGTRLAIGAPLS